MDFRKKRTLKKHHAYRSTKDFKMKCDFCITEPSSKKQSFVYWKILKNIFPYDRIAEEHDLIIPKRHFQHESEMTNNERAELVHIKSHQLSAHKKYDFIWENFLHMRSMEHYHLHLLRFKRKK